MVFFFNLLEVNCAFVREKKDRRIYFSQKLSELFGIDKNDVIRDRTELPGFFLPDDVEEIFVITDIVEPQTYGTSCRGLLRILESTTDKTQVIDRPIYVPIRHDRLTKINIKLCDKYGNLIPLEPSSDTQVLLHARVI